MNVLGQKILFNLRIRKDRRQFERVSTHQTLNLDYSKHNNHHHGSGIAKNISLGGILFAADRLLPVGTLLDLTLHSYPSFAAAGSLHTQGRVVRCFQTVQQNHFRIACVFDRLENPNFEKLKFLIGALKNKLR